MPHEPCVIVTMCYHRLPYPVLAMLNGLVLLVWCPVPLPILTRFVHVTAHQIRLVWFLLPEAYQLLPDITGPAFWVDPGHRSFYQRPSPLWYEMICRVIMD